MSSDTRSEGRAVAQGGRWALAVVAVTTFMLVLDVTVVVVALPDIQADLHASLSSLQWVIDAYTLALATLLLTAATLGDRLGRRRLFLVGTALFTVGSMACALAPSAMALDVFRGLQGIGGAVLFGVGLPIIAAAYPEGRARNGAIAAFGAASGTALALGPLIGGLLTQTLGWRAIFYLNIPIGIVVMFAAARRLSESRDPAARRPDWPGTVAVIVASSTLVFGLVRGNEEGWSSLLIVSLLGVAAAAFVAFMVIETRTAQPMLDLGLFRSASFTVNACVAFTVQATLVGALTYISLYVQNTLGFDPIGAGIRILPFTAVSFAVAIAAGLLLNHLPIRPLVAASSGFTAAGLVVIAHLDAGSTWTALIPGLLLSGVGLGLASTVVNQVALAGVPPERSGMASGAINALKQIGVAAGVAGLGALFATRAAASTADILTQEPAFPRDAAHAIGDAVSNGAGMRVLAEVPPAMRPVIEHAVRVGTTTGLNAILFAAAGAALVTTIIALVFIRPSHRRAEAPTAAVDPAASETGTRHDLAATAGRADRW
jgi:EmrB/QacA subfamily drug resistance transporter